MRPQLPRDVLPRLHMLVTGLVLTLALAGQASAATSYRAMYIFGDSLSETGNYAAIGAGGAVYPAPYAQGRFSNGDVWVDYLATALGLDAPTAAAAGGNNYAWGGARTAGQAGLEPPYDLGVQSLAFLSDHDGEADPAALYVVWAGGNDALAGDVTHTADNIGSVIAMLAGAGARNFLVPNLPVLGDEFAQVNVDLVPVLDSLEASLPLQLVRLDVAGLFMAIAFDTMNGGEGFGFADFDTPCFDGGTVCANPDGYLLWDALHPTTRGHELIGQMASAELAAVPLPAGIWLLGPALGALLVARRGAGAKPGSTELPSAG